MSENNIRVGFIGIGAMGNPMAHNILKAGFPLTVYDRNPEKTLEFSTQGVPVASSCADTAIKSDVVIIMIGQVAEELEAVLGVDGVFEGAHPGLTLIDMSTVGIVALKKWLPLRVRKGSLFLTRPFPGQSILLRKPNLV
jgi:3-hydroxyisobutyrate dehydrogenase